MPDSPAWRKQEKTLEGGTGEGGRQVAQTREGRSPGEGEQQSPEEAYGRRKQINNKKTSNLIQKRAENQTVFTENIPTSVTLHMTRHRDVQVQSTLRCHCARGRTAVVTGS